MLVRFWKRRIGRLSHLGVGVGGRGLLLLLLHLLLLLGPQRLRLLLRRPCVLLLRRNEGATPDSRNLSRERFALRLKPRTRTRTRKRQKKRKRKRKRRRTTKKKKQLELSPKSSTPSPHQPPSSSLPNPPPVLSSPSPLLLNLLLNEPPHRRRGRGREVGPGRWKEGEGGRRGERIHRPLNRQSHPGAPSAARTRRSGVRAVRGRCIVRVAGGRDIRAKGRGGRKGDIVGWMWMLGGGGGKGEGSKVSA